MAIDTDLHQGRVFIPVWLLENEYDIKCSGSGPGTGFLRRTAAGISGMLQNDLLAERYAARNMFLQGIDPRLKLMTMLFFMILAGTCGSFPSLILLCAAALMLAKLSGLGMLIFIRRVWLVLPMLVLILSVPAAINLFIPGKPLLTIIGGLYFTSEGLAAILKVSFRVGISISFGYLLVMTTRWSHLTRSLRLLKIPSVITAIFDITYRYIFVLVQISVEMFEARYLRTTGIVKNSENRRFVAGGIALMFLKASHMSGEIYDSMLCRCYCGDPVGLESFSLTRNDIVWAVNFIIIVSMVILF